MSPRLAASLGLSAIGLATLAGAGGAPVQRPHLMGDEARAVQSLFAEQCVRCHGPKRQRGDLRLDLPGGIRSVVVAGRPEDSELLRRISLPPDDFDVMPPEEPFVTAENRELVRRWIAAGPDLTPFEEELAGEEATESLLAEVRSVSGARVRWSTGDGAASAPGLSVDWSLSARPPRGPQLAALERIASKVVELSLAGQLVLGPDLDRLPRMPGLRRLRLQRSRLDDAGLGVLLRKAPGVVELNLHSTGVSARSVRALLELPSLTRLVVYDTPLEADGLDRLRAGLHRAGRYEVQVVTAANLPTRPFEHGGPRRVLVADASKQRIALLREVALEHFDTEWEHPIEALHDLQWLDGERVLFQETWTRLLEVDTRSGRILWSYDAATTNREPGDGPVEVHAFRRLADGITLIAESGPARLIEVDHEGELVRRIPLTVDRPHVHHDTRLVRKTDAGTYLVAHEADGFVREYGAGGELVWSYEVPLFGRERAGGHGPEAFGNQVFGAWRRPGGTTLIATGNGHSVLEVDGAGEIVWSLSQDELEGVRLAWVTTVQELSNGNLVIGNCHAGEGQPQLIEVTRDKRVVWRFEDFERMGNSLSNAWVIEDLTRLGAGR